MGSLSVALVMCRSPLIKDGRGTNDHAENSRSGASSPGFALHICAGLGALGKDVPLTNPGGPVSNQHRSAMDPAARAHPYEDEMRLHHAWRNVPSLRYETTRRIWKHQGCPYAYGMMHDDALRTHWSRLVLLDPGTSTQTIIGDKGSDSVLVDCFIGFKTTLATALRKDCCNLLG